MYETSEAERAERFDRAARVREMLRKQEAERRAVVEARRAKRQSRA